MTSSHDNCRPAAAATGLVPSEAVETVATAPNRPALPPGGAAGIKRAQGIDRGYWREAGLVIGVFVLIFVLAGIDDDALRLVLPARLLSFDIRLERGRRGRFEIEQEPGGRRAAAVDQDCVALYTERARARETLHSTAAEAALVAQEAGVKLLALTHVSTRYFGHQVVEEASQIFPS